MSSFKNLLSKSSGKGIVHIALWIIFGLYLVFISNDSPFSWFNISNVIIALVFFAFYVYFNAIYLIPNFLKQRSVLTYFLLFFTSALILTPLRSLVYYLRFWGMADLQNEVLSSQWFTFLSFLIVGGVTTTAKIVINWVEDQRRMRELEKENLQSELKFLRSQINPHFLFNTLNSLYALTLKKSDLAPEMLIRLSEIMRYMLYDCNEPKVLLEKEVKFMGNYVELERLRYGEDVEIDFKLEGEIQDQKIAPLLFIPFFENAFKHGLSNRIGQGWISISFLFQEELVTLVIENSVPEEKDQHMWVQKSKSKSDSSGIGLENIKRRLNLLYPDEHTLDIEKSPKQFKITLTINLSSDEKH